MNQTNKNISAFRAAVSIWQTNAELELVQVNVAEVSAKGKWKVTLYKSLIEVRIHLAIEGKSAHEQTENKEIQSNTTFLVKVNKILFKNIQKS